ncbi:MAG: 7TM diverse intracellular signaling domain-containing protein [Oligoflexus sp.]
MKWSRFFIFLVSFLGAQIGYCLEVEPLVINDNDDSYIVAPQSYLLIDRKSRLDFSQVRSGRLDRHFKKVDAEVPSYGFTSYTYWFRFDIHNTRQEDLEWLLAFEYPMLDRIDIYYQTEGSPWVHRYGGDHFAFNQREVRHRYFYFRIPFEAEQTVRFFVRIHTDGSAEFPMYLKSPYQLYLDNHTSQMMQGIFLGFMGILAFYNIFLFIGSRKAEYFYYSLFLCSIALFKATMNGVSFEYFWPWTSWWANQAAYFTPPFVFLAAVLYTYKFLQFDQNLRYRYIYRMMIGTFCCLCVISLFMPGKFTIVSIIFGLASSILMLVSSTDKALQGYRPATYYLTAWLALILGSLIYGLQKLGIIPVTSVSLYVVELAAGLQGILLSLGQSEKINTYHREIRKAQKKSIQNQMEINRINERMNQELERLVHEKTRDISVILQHIQQGIFTVEQNGEIFGDYSQHLIEIFGEKNLRDRNVFDVLLNRSNLPKDQQSQIQTIIMTSVGQDFLNFEANSHLLPNRLELMLDNDIQYLELEWTPILADDDSIEKFMITVRDVTEIRAWEQMQAEHDREQLVMHQILKIDALRFKSFLNSSLKLADECLNLLNQNNPERHWTIVLRNIHTLKGNSRTYGFTEVADFLHHLEEDILQASNGQSNWMQKVELATNGVETCIEMLGEYREINDRKLERNLVGELEELAISSFHMIEELSQLEIFEQYQHLDKFRGLADSLARYARSPLKEVLAPVIDSVPVIAKELKKPIPEIHFSGSEFPIDKTNAHMFENIFIHLFRNSLDHGFDFHDDAKIHIHCIAMENHYTIHYKDNGRGLDVNRLQKKGLKLGLIGESVGLQEIVDLIFAPGFSSRDTTTNISGRGVGMDAIRSFLTDIGGDITIKLGLKTGQGFQKFHFELQIPKDLPNINEKSFDSITNPDQTKLSPIRPQYKIS